MTSAVNNLLADKMSLQPTLSMCIIFIIILAECSGRETGGQG